jgi:hypothetical protein
MAVSLRKPNASSSAVLMNKLDPRSAKRGYDSFPGLGPATNFALSCFQPLDGWDRYP